MGYFRKTEAEMTIADRNAAWLLSRLSSDSDRGKGDNVNSQNARESMGWEGSYWPNGRLAGEAVALKLTGIVEG